MRVARLCAWGSLLLSDGTTQVLSPRSEYALLDQVPDSVLGPPQDNPSVTVTEGDEIGTRCDAGLRQQAERQLDPTLIIDMEFGWFPEHGKSVAPSESRTSTDWECGHEWRRADAGPWVGRHSGG